MDDFLIVGAGVIGMMLARELVQAGAKVALVDRGVAGREASWAGGGIVSPLYPWRYLDAVTQLSTWSQSSYLHLSQALLEETGCDPELRQKGMFMVSVDDEDQALAWAAQYQRPLRRVDADYLYQLEPNFALGYASGLWMPEVCSIRNPRLGRALRESLQSNSAISLYENCEVRGFKREGDHVLGVHTSKGELCAGRTVLTAGAWSGELLAQLSIKLPVEPVKGQMMVFKAPIGLIDRVILLAGRYVIPRSDGRILVGSTLEHVGFDKQATEQAYQSLYDTAVSIIPQLENFPVEHHWAGLRPGSPQGIPYIGNLPTYKNLSVNAGQFRNGLVLAPASTRLHADLLLGRTPIVDPAPYCPERQI